MSSFAAPIAEQIWDMKYRLKDASGAPVDQTVEDTWRRIARALAEGEQEPGKWEETFYGALEGFKFLPAGRIVAGAGTARSVTLFNCFVMGTIPDSMGGIFDMLKEAALTMQQGGGIGYDFSDHPAQGRGCERRGGGCLWPAVVHGCLGCDVPHDHVGGFARRGAMMATMRCDHPDIEDFIGAKSDPARLRNVQRQRAGDRCLHGSGRRPTGRGNCPSTRQGL